MVARSSLLRRPNPGARPARRTSSVVAAVATLAPRLVRLARHDYPDGLLRLERGQVPETGPAPGDEGRAREQRDGAEGRTDQRRLAPAERSRRDRGPEEPRDRPRLERDHDGDEREAEHHVEH